MSRGLCDRYREFRAVDARKLGSNYPIHKTSAVQLHNASPTSRDGLPGSHSAVTDEFDASATPESCVGRSQ